MNESVKKNEAQDPDFSLPKLPEDKGTEPEMSKKENPLKKGIQELLHPQKPLSNAWKERAGMIVVVILMALFAFAPFAGVRIDFIGYGGTVTFGFMDFWPLIAGFEILMVLVFLTLLWGEKHAVLIMALMPGVAILIGAFLSLYLFRFSFDWLPATLQQTVGVLMMEGDMGMTCFFTWGFFALLVCELVFIVLAFLYYHHDTDQGSIAL